MTTTAVLVSTQDKVTTVSLNRPDKCNALNGELIEQLRDAFYAASRDPQTQLVLLKGEGAHFCAGADIDWMQKLAQGSYELGHDDARNLASLMYTLYTFPKPIVTLAQGSVMGGGLGLLACSDIAFVSEDAGFCFSEVKLGLVPAVVSPYIVALIGQQAARYYFLTAERFDAVEAVRLGLAHKQVPREQLAAAGLQLIQTILKNSPAALSEVKRLLPLVASEAISPGLSEKTAEIFAKMRVSQHAQEGLKAFLEKRPPHWEETR